MRTVGIAANLGLDGRGRHRRQRIATEVVSSLAGETSIEMFVPLMIVLAPVANTDGAWAGLAAGVRVGNRVSSGAGIFACEQSLDELLDADESSAQVPVFVPVLKRPARFRESPLDARRTRDLTVTFVFTTVALRTC